MKRCIAILGFACSAAALAVPIVPTHVDEMIETLPSRPAERQEELRLRRMLMRDPGDAALAVQLARRHLERARADGDPRHAGQALGALAAWGDADAPTDVLLMRATVHQHLHDFDAAASELERVLAREPAHSQAWLTLATVRRVQGRYDASDAACDQLMRLAVQPYGAACHAENDALRGDVEAARLSLRRLVALTRGNPELRAWLLTTSAEIEQRAGAPAAAEDAYRAALRECSDLYAALAYADLLLEQKRGAEAARLLEAWPRSDAVLLRLALAEPQGAAAHELRARIEQANQRPGTQALHGREQARFALGVDRDAVRALRLARDNVRLQREPVDLLVLAQAAMAGGDARALDEARELVKEVGLHDRRIDELL
jgi:predicted Zn-dependent protease